MLLCEVLASLTNSPVAISASQMGIGTSTRGRVQAAVEMILQEYGRTMRIQDIHAEFIRRGVPLPGRGTYHGVVSVWRASLPSRRKTVLQFGARAGLGQRNQPIRQL